MRGLFVRQIALFATTVALTIGAMFAPTPLASAAPTVPFQLFGIGLDDCPAGCIRVVHPIWVTLNPPTGGKSGYTGAVLAESERGGETVQWFNPATGRSGMVALSTRTPVLVATGAGAVTMIATTAQQLSSGAGIFWVP